MHFDWTINAGNILTALGLLLGFVAAHIQNIRTLTRMDMKVGLMYKWFTTHVVKINGSDSNE